MLVNGTYPKNITNVNELITALGNYFSSVINIKDPTSALEYLGGPIIKAGTDTGNLISAISNEAGTDYFIYSVSFDEDRCYGLTKDGKKAGPNTLSNLKKELGEKL